MTRTKLLLVVAALALLTPAVTMAQEGGSSVAGVVKDASGGVLPGVTVEASSPALIEKAREATTDGRGRYEIVGLRPGEYTVTFSLGGFATVKREGIILTGELTATVDAELKVGAVEETITVSGQAPVLDVTTAKRETVLTNDVIEALPSSGVHSSLAQLIPGVQTANQDVGGTVVAAGLLSGHGTHGPDSRIMVNGLSQGSSRNSGGGVTTPNMAAMEESTVDYAGVGADSETGGIQVNLVPKEGGNSLKSSSYVNFSSSKWQGNNLTGDLQSRGLLVRDSIKDNSDINPGFGGPIKRDKLWYYFSSRNLTTNNYVGGLFINRNAGNPNAWTFDPDPARQAANDHHWLDNQGRLTWQASTRNKLAFTIEEMRQCECPSGASATAATEASAYSANGQKHQYFVDYSFPMTSKILFEAYFFYREDDWTTGNRDGTQGAFPNPSEFNTVDQRYLSLAPHIVPISIQSSSFSYRAQTGWNDSHHIGYYYRANMSYVTGSHNIKVGFNNEPARLDRGMNVYDPLYYRISKPLVMLPAPANGRLYDAVAGGAPNQLTLNTLPYYPKIDVRTNMGIYAQDKWTTNRLTVGVGVRYDQFIGGWRDQHFGPAALAPTRDISFAAGQANNWKDITPRSALTYDLFGNGKTAVGSPGTELEFAL